MSKPKMMICPNAKTCKTPKFCPASKPHEKDESCDWDLRDTCGGGPCIPYVPPRKRKAKTVTVKGWVDCYNIPSKKTFVDLMRSPEGMHFYGTKGDAVCYRATLTIEVEK